LTVSKHVLLTLMTLALTVAGPSWGKQAPGPKKPPPGGANGGGGDHNSQEFAKIGFEIAERLSKQKSSIKIDTKLMKSKIAATAVEFTFDDLSLNGVRKDAINYPLELLIRIDQKVWDILSKNAREALVLHEYLGIMEINDVNYVISYKLLNFVAEKLACDVTYSNSESQGANLSAQSEPHLNSARQPPFAQQQLAFGNATALRLVWDLGEVSKIPTFGEVRNVRVVVNSDRLEGNLHLNLMFLSSAGENLAARSRAIHIGLTLTNDFNPPGSINEGAGVTLPFPIPPMSFGINSSDSKYSSVYCRVL
jgi:hypothetical protein